MTPFQWVVATRRRLWTAAILSGAVALGLAPLVSSFVRDHSGSIGDDMLALTGWCLLALGCSLCVAILLGERLFTYGWRERVFLGLDVTPPEPEDPMEPPVVLKAHTGAFVFVWLFALLACLGGLELATGGVFAEYQRVGRMRTLLRSDNHELKRSLMGEIAELRTEEEVRAGLPIVDMAWRDKRQPEEVQLAALESLGRLSLSLVSSATSWRKDGVHDHWEMDVLRNLRSQIVPDLRLAFDGASGRRKGLLALALGKVRDHRSLKRLVKAARQGLETDQEESRASLAALGVLHDPEALQSLVEMAPALYDSDAAVFDRMMTRAQRALGDNAAVASMWGELEVQDRNRILRAWLITGSPDESAAVEAYGMFVGYLGDLGERLPADDIKLLIRQLSGLTRDGVLVDRAVFTALAYAVGETTRLYIPETDDDIDAYFDTLVEVFGGLANRGPLFRKCEAVDVLRKTGHAGIGEPLMKLFDADGSEALCPSAYVDLGERAPEVVVTSELLRLRILRALALVAVGNDEVLEWARARSDAAEDRYGEYIQTQIRELLRLAEARER